MACELYTFDSCSRFHVAYDTHDMCAPCRHKEGHQECTRDSNCQYCINWSDIEWSLYERNLQRKGYRRQKKLWKTPWQLALKIQKTRQQRNRRWKILEVSLSLLTKSRPKGLLFRGIWTMRCHQHLPGGWREMVIGVTRTGIAVAIGVRMIPTGKDIFTNGHQVPEAVRETWLVNGAAVPLNPKLTVQLESLPPGTGLPGTKVQLELVPHGTGLPWARVQLEPTPHGPGLPRTIQLESLPEGTGLPQTNTLDTVPPGAIRTRVGLQLEPCPLGTGPLRTGLQAIGLPPPARKVLLPWSPVELELTLRTWLLSTVELGWALRAWLLLTVREPFPLGTGPPLTILETSPRDPSPSGVEVTADASPAGAGSLQNQSAADCPDCLQGGTDLSGQDQTPSAYTVTATNRADTADRGSSVDWTHSTAEASSTHRSSRHCAGGLHGNAHRRRYGVTVHSAHWPIAATRTAACYPDYHTGESSEWAMKTLPVQPTVSVHDRNTALPPVSVPIMVGLHKIHPAWQCPLLAWMCWTIRLGSSDGNQHHATASAGCLSMDPTTTVRSIGPADVVSWTAICAAAHSYCWCTEPAGPECCHHGVSHVNDDEYRFTTTSAYGLSWLRTWNTEDTSSSECMHTEMPGEMAIPRFSAPTSVHTMLPGTPMVAASTVFLAGKTDYD